jgi:general secretion pathway protein C
LVDASDLETTMDVTASCNWEWLGKALLPGLATAVLVIAVGQRLAELTWALVPSAPLEDPARFIVFPAPPERAPRMQVPRIADAHLFGERPVVGRVATPEVDGPETTLDLSLIGILSVTSKEGEDGSTIISSGGEQGQLYRIGQTIDGSDATVRWVYADRVILDRSGKLEYLSLPNIGSGAPTLLQ